jgi:NAD(P)-dependent dehydrogenase (short-subunit alcohol dehydrogenase family)
MAVTPRRIGLSQRDHAVRVFYLLVLAMPLACLALLSLLAFLGFLLSGDVADPEFCRQAVRKTVGEFGKLDILVNNAAFQEHVNRFEDLSE